MGSMWPVERKPNEKEGTGLKGKGKEIWTLTGQSLGKQEELGLPLKAKEKERTEEDAGSVTNVDTWLRIVRMSRLYMMMNTLKRWTMGSATTLNGLTGLAH